MVCRQQLLFGFPSFEPSTICSLARESNVSCVTWVENWFLPNVPAMPLHNRAHWCSSIRRRRISIAAGLSGLTGVNSTQRWTER